MRIFVIALAVVALLGLAAVVNAGPFRHSRAASRCGVAASASSIRVTVRERVRERPRLFQRLFRRR